MRPRGTAAELEQRRRAAVALMEEGIRPAQVARAVGTSRASVTRWRQAYRRGGEAALAATPHPGGRSKLTERQRRRLVQLLLEGPRRQGYASELWTLARVAKVIAVEFGVVYHPSQVWRILRRLGWSSQKPQRRARERNEEAIQRWRQQDWPRIKKRPADRPQHPLPR